MFANLSRMISLLYLILIAALQSALTMPAKAQTGDAALDATLSRLTDAYGGEALMSLSSIAIETDRRLAWPGQGQTADFVEFVTDRQVKHFDLVAKAGSVERWIRQNGGVYHDRSVMMQEGFASIDYFDMSVRKNPDATYMQAFHPDHRMSDLLMAHYLSTESVESLRYETRLRYGDHIHDVISLELHPETPRTFVYIGHTDGLIRRVEFERSIGTVNILLSHHRRVDGVRHATEMQVFLGDTLVEYESDQTVIVNEPVADKIAIDPGLREPFEGPDMSEMSVDQLGDGLYWVGQDDYSLFIEQDGAFMAVNTYPGLKDRYDALVAQTKRDLPLRHAIVSHHHSDHMDGIEEAHALGATLHVTGQTRTLIERSGEFPDDLKLTALKDDSFVGPLRIFIRSTPHATDNAVIYHPGAKLLFQDDHYHGLRADGPSRIQPSVPVLFNAIAALNLPIDLILSGHTRKAEPWDMFEAALSGGVDICPSRRAICLDQVGA